MKSMTLMLHSNTCYSGFSEILHSATVLQRVNVSFIHGKIHFHTKLMDEIFNWEV